ncbi:MAG: hypothetical protein LBL21_02610 [Rickettsiales bacterium]|nr:hypothetical protein [Rickettsiales bacterium]
MKNKILTIIAVLALPACSSTSGIIPDNSSGGNIHFGTPSGPSKIPVLNINKPNAKGVSINKFHRFDVDERGLIINNQAHGSDLISGSSGDRVESNPNFGTANAARQVLIEVNPGGEPSKLYENIETLESKE